MNLSIRAPKGTTAAIARQLLRDSYRNNTAPEPLPDAGLEGISLFLPNDLASLVSQAAEGRKVPPSTEAAERIYAASRPAPANGSPSFTPSAVRKVGSEAEMGDLRETARRYAAETITGNRIGFIEAATGLGKSRLIADAAIRCLAHQSNATVWIAAPTLTILSHLIAETRHLPDFPVKDCAMLLGRGQYLDGDAVEEGCTDLLRQRSLSETMRDQIHVLLAWVRSGATPQSAATRVFADLVPDLSHMLEDGKMLAPDLPLASWSLAAIQSNKAEDEEDSEGVSEAEERLARDREHAQSRRIVFTTHAFLAATLRLRSVRKDDSPVCSHLIVDEAHQLEETVAAGLGYEYHAYAGSLWAKRLGAEEGADQLRNETRRLREALTGLCANMTPGPVRDAGVADHFRQLLHPLSRLTRRYCADSQMHRTLTAILKDDAPLYLSFSPVRRFPSITTGPGSVRGFLDKLLWSRVRAALLYSATLYLPSKTGEASCHYIRVKLGVPLERSISFAPLYYRDVLSPLMLLPSPAAAPALTYPGGSGQSEEDDDSPSPSDGTDASSRYGAWVGNCSQQIVIAADTARGGTLVLCTSFSDLRAIAGRMPASMQDRLVDPAGEHTVPRNAALFRKLHRSGKRPIWIATGAAWTGLDLRDEQAETAEADTLLTDLVIVRTPLCLVRTTTQLQRREWMGFESDMFEALIRLKQGLGRLVRRPGLHDRRIHVLDGRLVTLSKPHFRFYRRFLEDYRNKGELSGAHTPLPASKSQGT